MRTIITFVSIFLNKDLFPSRDDAKEKLHWIALKAGMELREDFSDGGAFSEKKDKAAWGPFFIHADVSETPKDHRTQTGTFVLEDDDPQWFRNMVIEPGDRDYYVVTDVLANILAEPQEDVPMCLGTWHKIFEASESDAGVSAVESMVVIVTPGVVVQDTSDQFIEDLISTSAENMASLKVIREAGAADSGVMYTTPSRLREVSELMRMLAYGMEQKKS